MASLPTITVTPAQLAKCVEAFTDAAGYKSWLTTAVREEVQRRLAASMDEAAYAAKRAALESLEAELPPADPA